MLLFQYIFMINKKIIELSLQNCIEFNKNWWSDRPKKLIRNFGNKLGLAWWAKIETDQPSSTYWFGPFITKRSLKENMSSFIKDLSDEGSKNIKYSIVRCKKEEPLTVW